jgi:hypothetical protein
LRREPGHCAPRWCCDWRSRRGSRLYHPRRSRRSSWASGIGRAAGRRPPRARA